VAAENKIYLGGRFKAAGNTRAGRLAVWNGEELGLVFVAALIAVQWPFSAFLLSDAADNRFFARDGHWPYWSQPGDWMNSFWDQKEDPLTLKGVLGAFVRAAISTRLGLWLGNYLLRLKR